MIVFPTREPWSRKIEGGYYEVGDMRCPSCDWTAENEVGYPLATEEFLRAGPLCRLCGTQLLTEIKQTLVFDPKRGLVPA